MKVRSNCRVFHNWGVTMSAESALPETISRTSCFCFLGMRPITEPATTMYLPMSHNSVLWTQRFPLNFVDTASHDYWTSENCQLLNQRFHYRRTSWHSRPWIRLCYHVQYEYFRTTTSFLNCEIHYHGNVVSGPLLPNLLDNTLTLTSHFHFKILMKYISLLLVEVSRLQSLHVKNATYGYAVQ